MSFDFTSSANHADSTATPVTGAPCWLSLWVKTTIAQSRHLLTLCGDVNNLLGALLSVTNTQGQPVAYVQAGSGNATQVIGALALPAGWTQIIVGFPTTGFRNVTINGGQTNQNSSVGLFNPAGINKIIWSGRLSDHAQNIGGLSAHAALGGGRDMTATERLYIGAGGNVRAISNLSGYWKGNRLTSGGLIVPDELGVTPMNVTGSLAIVADDPVTATWFTGAAITSLLLQAGVAVNINLSTGFDAVSSAFTCSLLQLGVATQVTTANGATSVSGSEIALASSTAFSVGDYIQIGVSGMPYPVLYNNSGSAIVLFGGNTTWANAAPVFRIPTSVRAITGTSIVGNALTGTASSVASFPNCLIRATSNSNAALFADSDIFPISVTSPAIFPKRRTSKRRRFVKLYIRR